MNNLQTILEQNSIEKMLDDGYKLYYAKQGQIFPRDGWYLQKSDEDGNVDKIIYLDNILKKIYHQGRIYGAEEHARLSEVKRDESDNSWNACVEEHKELSQKALQQIKDTVL